MASVYYAPQWFVGFDITLEFLFAIVTAIVAIIAARMYQISQEKNILHFSRGFLCISLSYFIWAIVNASIVKELISGSPAIILEKLSGFWLIGIYTYLFLFIAGLVTIVYATLNIKRGDIYYLLLGLPLIAIGGAYQKILIFRLVSIFLLAFIIYRELLAFMQSKKANTLFVTLAFTFIFISHIDLIFLTMRPTAYVLSHLLELGAYALLAITLLRALKKQ
jgi:hypothetical protein